MRIFKNIYIKDRVCNIPADKVKKLMQVEPATIGHYTEFGFMHPRIHCLVKPVKIAGNAVTVRIPPQDSEAVYQALDTVKEGDILVIDRSNDTIHACVGEVVALTAAVRKVAAIIVDGPITDLEEIREIDIPVYGTGTSNLTTKFLGSGGEVNMDISCGGVVVHPGDVIMADENGVLCLRPFEIDTLLDTALKDEEEEVSLRRDIREGKSVQEFLYS